LSQELLNRIAALENELAPLRGRNVVTKQQLLTNPLGAYASLGLTPEEKMHVQRVNFADALGDQAPPDMRMYAQLGPQMAQMSSLATAFEALSRRVEEMVVVPKQAETTRESVKALIANKEVYPFLSAAVAANPALLDARTKGRTGEAADIAKELEAEAALFATTYGYKPAQPASENADKSAPSQQSKPASLVGAAMDVPPLPEGHVGPITPEEDKRLQDEISKKYGL
jgi:hypothetical protein